MNDYNLDGKLLNKLQHCKNCQTFSFVLQQTTNKARYTKLVLVTLNITSSVVVHTNRWHLITWHGDRIRLNDEDGDMALGHGRACQDDPPPPPIT